MKITLRAARINAGLTNTEAAAKLGISTTTLSNYEMGKYLPKTKTLLKMGEVYGLRVEDLNFPAILLSN